MIAFLLFINVQSQAEGISLARIPHIHEVAIDPAQPDHLILATPRGLYRLTPTKKMQPLLVESHDITGLVISDNGKFLLVSGKKKGQPFGILLSANGGKSWKTQSDTKLAYRLMKLSGPKGRLLAVEKKLLRSNNAGKKWTEVSDMPQFSLGLSPSRKSAQHLLAATAKGLKASKDGGKTWNIVNVGAPAKPGKPVSMVGRDSRDGAWAFVVGAGLFSQKTSGEWQIRAKASQFNGAIIHLAAPRNQVSAPSSGKHLVAITQYMKILQSKDNGQNWQNWGK